MSFCTLPRHLYECASECSSSYFCSAFRFDANEKVCQLGTKDVLLTPTTPQSTGVTIPIHINPNSVQIGNLLTNYISDIRQFNKFIKPCF